MIQFYVGKTLSDIEKEVIEYTYKYFDFNKTQTAHALGVSVKTIDNKLKRYEEDRKAKEDSSTKSGITLPVPRMNNAFTKTDKRE